MTNNKFKTPLIQSAFILGAVIILFVILGSGTDSTGNSISVLASIGHAILFCIGMPIAISLSIAILIGIFLAAVAMVDSTEASQMFADIKKKRTN